MCATLLVDLAPRDTLVASSVAISGRGESQYTWLSVATVYYHLDNLLLVGTRRSRQQTAVSINSTMISIL